MAPISRVVWDIGSPPASIFLPIKDLLRELSSILPPEVICYEEMWKRGNIQSLGFFFAYNATVYGISVLWGLQCFSSWFQFDVKWILNYSPGFEVIAVLSSVSIGLWRTTVVQYCYSLIIHWCWFLVFIVSVLPRNGSMNPKSEATLYKYSPGISIWCPSTSVGMARTKPYNRIYLKLSIAIQNIWRSDLLIIELSSWYIARDLIFFDAQCRTGPLLQLLKGSLKTIFQTLPIAIGLP